MNFFLSHSTMEKTLTRLKSNLKSRRKLSLPMLVGQFHQHWNGTDHPQQQVAPNGGANGPKSAESEDILYEDGSAASAPLDDLVDGSDDESTPDELSNRSAMGKAWLSFSRSRRAKARNKPRRWPSTPAFLPTSSRSSSCSSGSPLSSSAANESQPSSVPHPLAPLPPLLPPPSSSLAATPAANVTAKVSSTVRPQPYIQGYHLTLPSFLGSRSHQRHLSPPTTTNQSQQRNRQMYQVVKTRKKTGRFGLKRKQKAVESVSFGTRSLSFDRMAFLSLLLAHDDDRFIR